MPEDSSLPTEYDGLTRARETAEWDAAQGPATSHSPDDRTVPSLLAGILDALVAIAERLPAPVNPPASQEGAES